MTELNINDLLNEEIKKAISPYENSKDENSYENRLILINKISDEILSKIEKESLEPERAVEGHTIISGLFTLLTSGELKNLPTLWAGEIFSRINKGLEAKKNGKDIYRLDDISYVQKSCELAAVEYFRRKAICEINQFDLPKKLSEVKKRLGKPLYHIEFEQKALVELQEEFEKEIAIQKEEILLRNQLNLPESVEAVSNEPERGKGKYFISRNEKQVFLALEIMLRLLRSTANPTDKGKLMSFLSGYSAEAMRQSFSKSETWKDKRENLQYIHGLCLEFGLSTVRKEIEREIANIDKKT